MKFSLKNHFGSLTGAQETLLISHIHERPTEDCPYLIHGLCIIGMVLSVVQDEEKLNIVSA